MNSTDKHPALVKMDAEIYRLQGVLEVKSGELSAISAELNATRNARSIIFDALQTGELKRLPAPRKAPKKAQEPKAERAPRKSKTVPAAKDTGCPLDWEIGGVTLTLPLEEALMVRALLGTDDDPNAPIISQGALMDICGFIGAPAFFSTVRSLRQTLANRKTGHTIENIRGEGYRLVQET